jgi:hypothetical protein
MGRIAFRLALGGLALYLYLQDSIFWAGACVVVLVWSLIQQDIEHLLRIARGLATVPEEHQANCQLTYTIGLEQVFEHPVVNDLFAKLKARHKAPAETVEGWRKLLAESYTRKYKRDDLVCEVRFNIKGNLLFVDDKPSFRDYIYHQVEIPYRWTESGEPQEALRTSPEIESELYVRALILNGWLILQIGYFSKEYSPRTWVRGLAAYETYATLTSFPLMYFSHRHGIPVRYLNVVAEATPSYAAAERSGGSAKDKYRDWKSLHQDIAIYRLLCASDNEPVDIEAWNKHRKAFEERHKQLVAEAGYRSSMDSDDWGDFPDYGYTYWNQYVRIFFHNLNTNRGTEHERQWLAGYYEERP